MATAFSALSHAPHQPSQNRTIPRKLLTPLPPLSKGGGLKARHKLLLCCFLLAICPPFLYCKLFCRKTEGLLSIRTINEIFRTISITFRTAIVCVLIWFCICTIPLAFRRVSVCVCFICFASLRNFGHTRLRHPCLACPSRCTKPCHFHSHLKRTYIPRFAPNFPPKNTKIRHLQ